MKIFLLLALALNTQLPALAGVEAESDFFRTAEGHWAYQGADGSELRLEFGSEGGIWFQGGSSRSSTGFEGVTPPIYFVDTRLCADTQCRQPIDGRLLVLEERKVQFEMAFGIYGSRETYTLEPGGQLRVDYEFIDAKKNILQHSWNLFSRK